MSENNTNYQYVYDMDFNTDDVVDKPKTKLAIKYVKDKIETVKSTGHKITYIQAIAQAGEKYYKLSFAKPENFPVDFKPKDVYLVEAYIKRRPFTAKDGSEQFSYSLSLVDFIRKINKHLIKK